MNIRKLIEANLYIYKENIKLILNSCVDNVCIYQTSQTQMDNDILKEINKGKIEEIQEEDNEDGNISDAFNSHSNSKVSLSD